MTSSHQTIGDVSPVDAGSRTVVTPAETAQNSFSLVELLVVVAILSVLSSILTPALKSAHSASREVLCTKQKSDLFHVMTIYGDDHDDMVLHTRAFVNNQGKVRALSPFGRFIESGYMEQTKDTWIKDSSYQYSQHIKMKLECPEDPSLDAWKTYGRNKDFFYQNTQDDRRWLEDDHVLKTTEMLWNVDRVFSYSYWKTAQIERPSQLFFLSDSRGDNNGQVDKVKANSTEHAVGLYHNLRSTILDASGAVKSYDPLDAFQRFGLQVYRTSDGELIRF